MNQYYQTDEGKGVEIIVRDEEEPLFPGMHRDLIFAYEEDQIDYRNRSEAEIKNWIWVRF